MHTHSHPDEQTLPLHDGAGKGAPSVRIIVDCWTTDHIEGHSPNGDFLSIPLGPDFSYLPALLHQGSQLNVVCPSSPSEILFIYEPDALMDISSISQCIESYGSLPYNYLLSQIKPSVNSSAILMGNFAGQLLDEQVHFDDVPYAESIRTFFRHNAVQLATCPDLAPDFHTQARKQAEHIRRVVREVMPQRVKGFERDLVLLEPSFFCEMLGFQGRMDLLQLDYKVLIEQKAGRGAYPPGPDPDTPRQQPKHYVQMLLYMALLHYNFDIPVEHIQCFLLYSKYANSLLPLGEARHLLLDAIRVRNQVVWCEQWYAGGNTTFLDRLRPEHLNQQHSTDFIWDTTEKQLTRLLSPLRSASAVERAYYHRLMAFLHAEQWIGKVGSPYNPELGSATKWKLSLEEKVQAGCIYHGLHLLEPDARHEGRVDRLVLRFPEGWESDTTNFRLGDPIIVYPYSEGDEPDARRTMVQRGYLQHADDQAVVVRLRAPQTDARVFRHTRSDALWAIEHDSIDSTFGSLYRNLHTFLSAPQSRRDLLLAQRHPEVDERVTLCGDYGDFNELVLRAKQAREMFLVIGPPGTGKTSFGLVNILKEQLLSEPTSNVLLMSYTNRAVDEICSKLVEEGLDFLRLGSEASSVEEYHPYLLENRVQQCATVEDVTALLHRVHIFVATTTSMNGMTPLFSLVQFSLAIVDEASQILEPHIAPLLASLSSSPEESACAGTGETSAGRDRLAIRRFVLIGDHKQLPAVVQQEASQAQVTDPLLLDIGLTDCRNSFFQRMLSYYRHDPSVCYMLTRQGRMHPDIADFPNRAFYAGRLGVAGLSHQREASSQSRVRFFDVPAPRHSVSDKVNLPEAECIARLVAEASQHFAMSDIGIIVPYRNQIALIRSAMHRQGLTGIHDVTIDTVERYQGSQREVIIYGFTVQRPYQLDFLSQGNFVEDEAEIDRKLNVAMTRARKYLYMVGNATLLRQNTVFHQMLTYLTEHDSIIHNA